MDGGMWDVCLLCSKSTDLEIKASKGLQNPPHCYLDVFVKITTAKAKKLITGAEWQFKVTGQQIPYDKLFKVLLYIFSTVEEQ